MLEQNVQEALLRLVQVQQRGATVVDAERVETVHNLLAALPEHPEGTCDAPELARQALSLAGADGEMVIGLVALVGACQGEREAVAHARSLLDAYVNAQPAGRRPRRTASGGQPHVRMVGA